MATETRMKLISSGKKWEGDVAYSQCFRCEAGPLLYLSGQVSIDPAGKVVGHGDMAVQTRTVFGNIRNLLAAAGSTMEDVVKLTYFVVDMKRWSEVQKVRAEFFPQHHPASTTVEVTRLFKEEYLIEIEAVAVAR